jgi:hypothetical protein
MKFASVLRIVLSAALALAFSACAKAGGPAAYGEKVKFAKGQTLTFPDFELTYTGRRHVATPKYPRGFDYDDFTVSRGGVSKTVSWSAGTGLIDWADFEFGGKNFALELRGSRKFGWLKDNELVITRQ